MNRFYNNTGMITEVKSIQKGNEFGSSIQRELRILFKKKKKAGGIEYKCENRWIFLDGDEQLKWK